MSSKQTGMKASTAPLAVPEVRIRDEGRHRFSAERAGWQADCMHASIDNNDRFSPVTSKDKRKSRPVISTDPEDEKGPVFFLLMCILTNIFYLFNFSVHTRCLRSKISPCLDLRSQPAHCCASQAYTRKAWRQWLKYGKCR